MSPFKNFPIWSALSTEIELLDNASVSLDVNFLEVIKESSSFTYEPQE